MLNVVKLKLKTIITLLNYYYSLAILINLPPILMALCRMGYFVWVGKGEGEEEASITKLRACVENLAHGLPRMLTHI